MELLCDNRGKANIVVLAGTGGKGSSTICAARHLANRKAKVKLCLTNPDRLGEMPRSRREFLNQLPEGR